MDNETFVDALEDICFRIGELKNNSINESTYNQVDKLQQDCKELIENFKNE